MQFNDAFHVAIKVSTVLAALSCFTASGDSSQQLAEKKSQSAGTNRSDNTPPVLEAQINTAPLFDSQGGWSAGYVKAIGHGPGVVVGPGGDNPNVFAQQFPAKPNEPFKVIARASSMDKPKAMGRIQINWTDTAGKFISVSTQAFEVTPVEIKFEYDAVAPPAAANGTLYVVADGPENVVRYTEMRLLGKTRNEGVGVKANSGSEVQSTQSASSAKINASAGPFPRPPNLTPLDGSERSFTVYESQYYFYHSTKAIQRKAQERGMDFIMYVMPDYNISLLMPAIQQLRSEGIKVLAYEPQGAWTSGVDTDWYWQKADSHWTESAARLTGDEILHMWTTQSVANRGFSKNLMESYATGFPATSPALFDGQNNTVASKDLPQR